VGVSQGDVHLADAQELFRRMVFNILIDNTDDHEKNHSLLVVNPTANGRLRLAPAYDVLPTNSGQGYQEFICGAQGQDSKLTNAMSQCDAFGLAPAQAAAQVLQVIAVVNTWRAHFASVGVSTSDLENLAERLDGQALAHQRLTFDASPYQTAPPKRKPVSPFRKT
jgi:serine/threonine-protein kinase HipA